MTIPRFDMQPARDAYDETAADLDRLVEYARGFVQETIDPDGVTVGNPDEFILSHALTAALLHAPSWGRLELACALALAVARLVGHDAPSLPDGDDRG